MDEIIGRWAAGNPAAAEELYREYYGRVKEFIIRRGAHIVDAEDIAQEAMIAGLEGLSAGARPDRLTHWLLGIARHLSFRRKRQESDPALEHVVDPKRRSARSMAIRREMDGLLAKTLERMTPNDRQIVDLLYRAGLSRKEISDKLDLPIEAVHARADRAHSRLREALSRHFTTVTLRKLDPAPIGMEAIRALRPAFRQVIVARHLKGLKDREASLELQLPEATLRARLVSAYEMLRCDAMADFSKAREQYRAGKEEE
jgi:RNA polymerase sigma-70 factor (ECF subfamily)